MARSGRLHGAWARTTHRDGNGSDDVELGPHDLTGLFAAPRWLRDLGSSAWLAVGVTLFLVGAVWILSLTKTIVTPLITATVIAAVASPAVRALERRGLPRLAATAVLLLGIVAMTVVIVVVVVGGVTGEADALGGQLAAARDTIGTWLADLGVGPQAIEAAKDDASAALSSAIPALLEGVAGGLRSLSSLVFFLALTLLSTVFLLKDGPLIRGWMEGHMGMPRPVAHAMGQRVLQSLRGYFVGVTAVAVFNAVVVAIGALLLGVPLVGSIALITFLAAYVPYLGAWTAGIFSALIALGGAGPEAAVGMLVVQLLANGALQQLIQPIAYGAALGIHPLAVLLVTIAGGSLFGAVGLILAAPLTAAATKITADLARSRAEAEAAAAPPPPGEPAAVT